MWRAHLVDVVEFEVFQEKQQNCRDGFHNDLFVPIHINTKFHALQHCGPAGSDRRDQVRSDNPRSVLLAGKN